MSRWCPGLITGLLSSINANTRWHFVIILGSTGREREGGRVWYSRLHSGGNICRRIVIIDDRTQTWALQYWGNSLLYWDLIKNNKESSGLELLTVITRIISQPTLSSASLLPPRYLRQQEFLSQGLIVQSVGDTPSPSLPSPHDVIVIIKLPEHFKCW